VVLLHVKGTLGLVAEAVGEILLEDVAFIAAADEEVIDPVGAVIFMICVRIGLSPISTTGFGFSCDSSLSRQPHPPATMTVFMVLVSLFKGSTCGKSKATHSEWPPMTCPG
jgi:hypothetical protein